MAEMKKRGTTKKGNGLSSPLNHGLENPCPVWSDILISDVLDKIQIGKQNQIQSSEMLLHGRFPVIDQGQDYIAGYCNDESRVVRKELPLIIFGDHTRCVKYVDFPFVLGADGTKVLKPQASIFDAKFFYYALRSLDIPNRGYNRHFSVLKEKRIPVPPLPEQRSIAAILGQVQKAIEEQEKILALTAELKRTLLHQLFTRGLRNEPQKQTEIGPIPKSWEVLELSSIAKIERGKFSHRPRNEPRFYGGEYPFVQTGDISNCDGYVRSFTQTLNKDGLAISKLFPAGTILITIAANIGFTGILEFDSACPDSLIGISPYTNVQTEFLNYYLITQQPKMDRLAPKGTQKNINIQFLKHWLVPLPSAEEQVEIAKVLLATDRKIRMAKQKRTQLQDLFRTLLHELMTAKIRVAAIDIQHKN